MARTPKELIEKVAANTKAAVDDLERRIDQEMDAREYTGGIFMFTSSGTVTDRMFDELTKRYWAWTVELARFADQQDQKPAFTLTFTPK